VTQLLPVIPLATAAQGCSAIESSDCIESTSRSRHPHQKSSRNTYRADIERSIGSFIDHLGNSINPGAASVVHAFSPTPVD